MNPKQVQPKIYHLTEEEKLNVESRQQMIKQYQYLIHVINSDIVGYVKFGIYPRLSLKPDQEYTLSQDNSELTIKEADGKLYTGKK